MKSTGVSDASRKRAVNRCAILRALHFEGPLPRSELSRQLLIRKSSVTSIAADLIRQGLVREEKPHSFRTALELNAQGPCAIVARMGIGEIETARVGLDGRITAGKKSKFNVEASSGRILQVLEQAIAAEVRRSPQPIMGIGVADMGIVDPNAGIALLAFSLPHWRDVPVRAYLESRLDMGVRVETDTSSQLWACAWFDRHLHDCPTMLYVGLMAEGLGSALIVNQQIILGRTFCAGEVGHLRAGDEGRLCRCGKCDCLETFCSIPAIANEIAALRGNKPSLDAEGIAQAASLDPQVMGILDRVAGKLAGVLCHILASLDPDALVLGTPSGSLGRIFGELLRKNLRSHLGGLGSRDIRLIITGSDHRSTMRGIGGRVMDTCFRAGQASLGPGSSAPGAVDGSY
jgi:predicted NBD/HSP70 family sugar kinase